MTKDTHLQSVVTYYDTHPINEQQILEKLQQDGIQLTGLTEDILQNYDMDHYDGIEAIDKLAKSADLTASSLVLDVASGMGGPSRYIAHNYGCKVEGIDLTDSRVASAKKLTQLVGLEDRVNFRSANALENPFPDQTFDTVIAEEAWCHIPDKARLINECVRVTKVGGCLAFTDILQRSGLSDEHRDILYKDMSYMDLGTLDGYQDLLRDAGCIIEEAEDLSARWAVILRQRLEMYRNLKPHTVANFGEDVHQTWDRTYTLFVQQMEEGNLGGGRFLARRVK
jgi:sarcosine/dimethylglycine N-methyltransferase